MDNLDLYYDHYKETYDILRQNIVKRDCYVLYIFAIISLLIFFLFDPTNSYTIVKSILDVKLQIKTFSFNLINTVCVAFFLYTTLRYYQICLGIEKSYKYLHNIENTLSEMTGMNIDRESGNYLSSYPWLFEIIFYFYTYIFPILIISVSFVKAINILEGSMEIISYLNLLFLFITFGISILYIVDRERMA